MKRYTMPATPADRLPELVGAEAVAASLGISEEKVYALARGGELPAVSIGRAVRFFVDDVTAFAQSRRRKVGGDA